MFSKIITQLYMIIQERNQFKHSFIIKSLNHNIYKEHIAKFQINNCFENLTHEPIVFAHYFEKST